MEPTHFDWLSDFGTHPFLMSIRFWNPPIFNVYQILEPTHFDWLSNLTLSLQDVITTYGLLAVAFKGEPPLAQKLRGCDDV